MNVGRLLYILAVLISGFATAGCGQTLDQPKRPPGVPSAAFWQGGADGGNWYHIKSIDDRREQVSIHVFRESGETAVDKVFSLQCTQTVEVNLRELDQKIVFFDGKKISLKPVLKSVMCWLE
ncbi:MAG: hypothetical protein EOO88_01190 [Pedobacter sp.]|nr:MAG: hypothetical protein EOO88_01190 [Pedobacter sp.]